MKRPKVTVVAIIPLNEKIVMVKRASAPFMGKWSLPGGHLEFGEKLEDAVIREVEEETNLETRVRRLVGFRNYIGQSDIRIHYVIFCFECEAISYDHKAGEEVLEVALVDPKSIPPETISPAVLCFLKREKYL